MSTPGWRSKTRSAKRSDGSTTRLPTPGIAHGEPLADHSFDAWRRVLSVNLDGVFLTLRSSVRLIRAGGRGGAIVVVSSAAAVKAEPGIAAYGASKAGASSSLASRPKSARPTGSGVNAILPRGVQTPIWRSVPFFQQLVQETGDEQAAFDRMAPSRHRSDGTPRQMRWRARSPSCSRMPPRRSPARPSSPTAATHCRCRDRRWLP